MYSILVIGRSKPFRRTLAGALQDSGYYVCEAEDGLEGYRRFRGRPTDLVITEMDLPGQDGLTTIVAIRREFPESRIIAIECGRLATRAASLMGAIHTFAKPLAMTEMLKTVGELLPIAPIHQS